jgi:DNA-binding Lrp family transcriptional regulator
MDEIDFKILKELVNNAQAPFSEIAKVLNISHETVKKRYKKMKAEGIIESCSIIIDRSKLGYQGTAFLLISNTQSYDKMLTVDALKKINNIIVIGNIMGAFDILAVAVLKDLNDLSNTVEKVQHLPNVDRLEVAFLAYTYLSYVPIPRTLIKCDIEKN